MSRRLSKVRPTMAALATAAIALGSLSTAVAADKYATAAELGLMQGFPPPPDKRVTRANALLTPPFNRWSYLHMRMIYPSAPIAAAVKAIGIHGQWIYLDVERDIAIIKQSSQPVSKDELLNGYDLNAFYAIVAYLSEK